MADKKEMLISVNDTELKKFSRTIKEITAEGLKMSKAFGGNDMSKGFGSAMAVKSLLSMTDSMKKFRQISDETGRALRSGLVRDIGAYEKALESANRDVQLHTEKVNQLTKAAAEGFSVAKEELEEYDKKLRDSLKTQQNLIDGLNQLKAGGGGKSGPGMGQGLYAGMTVAQGLTTGIGAFSGAYQGSKIQDIMNLASLRGFEHKLLGEFAGGNFSTTYALQKGRRDRQTGITKSQGQILWEGGGGTGMGNLSLATGTVGSALDMGLGVMNLVRGGAGAGGGGGRGGADATGGLAASGAFSQIGGGAAGLTTALKNYGGERVMEHNTVAMGAEALKQLSPIETQALNFIQQTAGLRVGASKGLQGHHMQAWGQGTGFGWDMGQSMAYAQQGVNQFGVGMTMGGGGTTQEQFVSSPQQQVAWARAMQKQQLKNNLKFAQGSSFDKKGILAAQAIGDLDAFDRTATSPEVHKAAAAKSQAERDALTKAGWSNQGVDESGQTRFTRTTGGQQGLLSISGEYERKGFSQAGAMGIFGQMSLARGGDNNQAKRELEDIFSKGVNRGMTDGKFHEKIGEAVAANMINAGGAATDSMGLGSWLMSGLGGASTMRDVNSRISGLDLADQLGGNKTFNLMRTARGVGALGAGGTGEQAMGIANTNIKEWLSGSKALEDLGLNDKSFRAKMVGGNFNDMANAYLSGNKTLQAAGGDVSQLLKQHYSFKNGKGAFDKEGDQFVSAFAKTAGLKRDEVAGMFEGLAALGEGRDPSKGVLKSHGDATAEGTIRTQQQVMQKFYEKEISIRERYLDALGKSLGAVDASSAADNQDTNSFTNFMGQFIAILAHFITGKNVSADNVVSELNALQQSSSSPKVTKPAAPAQSQSSNIFGG